MKLRLGGRENILASKWGSHGSNPSPAPSHPITSKLSQLLSSFVPSHFQRAPPEGLYKTQT